MPSKNIFSAIYIFVQDSQSWNYFWLLLHQKWSLFGKSKIILSSQCIKNINNLYHNQDAPTFAMRNPFVSKYNLCHLMTLLLFGSKKVEYSDSFTLKAFEHLIELAIIKPTRTTAQWTQLPRTFLPIHLNVTWSQILGALQTRSRCPAILQQWASGTIDE
jgi:hypothetical protein